MNIFVLDVDPVIAAQLTCDGHVRKMKTESLQMLSTAKRELDGVIHSLIRPNGKIQHIKLLTNERAELKTHQLNTDGILEPIPINKQKYYIVNPEVFRSTHANHPCNVWTRANSSNFKWHYVHFCALLDEYAFRFKKQSACEWGREYMRELPTNIKHGNLTTHELCMPDEYKIGNVVESYRAFYKGSKTFATYNHGRPRPSWLGEHQ